MALFPHLSKKTVPAKAEQDPGAAGHLRDTSLKTGAEPSKQLRPFFREPAS